MKRPLPAAVAILSIAAASALAAPPRQTAYDTATVRILNSTTNVQQIPIETDYIPNVVQAENGAASAEALKAQAVTARSFLYYKLNTAGSIGDGQNDQVYTNGSPPSAAHLAAAASTEREILRFGSGTNDVTIAAFFVAGTRPSVAGTAPYGVAETGDSPSSTTEQYVTYNRGLAGNNIDQTSLGTQTSPPSSFPLNRGAMSQNGSDFLSDNGWNYVDILRFYYGQDIHLEVAKTPASNTKPALKTLANFDVDQGYFGSGIVSGRNANVTTATLTRVTTGTHAGTGAQQIALVGTAAARFDYFDLSGLGPNSTKKIDGITNGDANTQVASAATNLSMESIGSVGFWLKATAAPGADLTVSLLIDDDADGTEASRVVSVIADGTYRKYEWFLDAATDWDSFANGDGIVDGGYFSLDSIRLRGLLPATFTIDDVFYNASAVAPVPEPTTLAALGLLGLVVRRRRRA